MSDAVATLIVDTSPTRFRGNGPSWREYADALRHLDTGWRRKRSGDTEFGVFGPAPSWEDTIERGRVLFDLESWAHLDEDQVSLVAPTHNFSSGDALLGSIGRRSLDVRVFLFSEEAAPYRDQVLSLLKISQGVGLDEVPEFGGEILAQLCDVQRLGRAFATRLLALARPDAFVVLNTKSLSWLRDASELTLAGKRRSYRSLLEWVSRQEWYQTPEPQEGLDRRIWQMRAALLDAFAYRPWST